VNLFVESWLFDSLADMCSKNWRSIWKSGLW